MEWFYKLKKPVRAVIIALPWVLAVAAFVAASVTQLGALSAVGAVLAVVAIALTVLAVVKNPNRQQAAAQDSQEAAAASDAQRVNYSELEIEKDFYTKVVGVTFENDDGSSRQKNIAACKPGQGVVFRPVTVKGNVPAVAVFAENGKQLGNLGADLAEELRTKYPTNPMQATIAEITGGSGEKPTYGCNLHLIIYKAQK